MKPRTWAQRFSRNLRRKARASSTPYSPDAILLAVADAAKKATRKGKK